MLKCKDCLHYEVCRNWYILTGHSAKEADEISELEHEYEGNFCTYSKDKSLIAVPVRHGGWIRSDGYKYPIYTCSECKYLNSEKTSYCPHCGAKMDQEE